ncbi:MAG: Gfo/Idh/MocA family oxidoreductase [Chloroflexi bacterium]|nr:Gfo/Idh/MocA family oxidoreductase [Chloroflexota bacterium]MCL5075087.1 Gfo/Idh/MocA family oxidoreductase [Chloroflexota bacterium]
MAHELRVAVIGAGHIGSVHVRALRALGQPVVALASSDPERATRRAEALGVPQGYGDYRKLLDNERVDIVHVCTPPALHYPIVKDCLERGRHVVCEKPLTADPTESAALNDLASQKGLLNAVCFNIRYYPACQTAGEKVQKGELGKVHLIHGSYLQEFHLPETPWGWRFIPELAGPMRAITEIGSHWVDLVSHISGFRPQAVMSHMGTFFPTRQKPLNPPQTGFETAQVTSEDYASALLSFGSGALGALTVSEISSGRKNRLFFQVDGSDGSLWWDSEMPNRLALGHKTRANEELVSGQATGYAETFRLLFEDVYRHLCQGSFQKPAQPTYPTFADGHAAVLICDAIYRSAKEQHWIEVQI